MKKLYVDLEYYKDQLICCGWSYDDDAFIGCRALLPYLVVKALEDPAIEVVCHSKTDWRWLKEHTSVALAGPLTDTMVKAYVLNENTPLTLDWCAKRYANITMDKRIKSVANEPMFRCDGDEGTPDGTWVHLTEAPIEQVMFYNKADVAATVALDNALNAKMDEQGWTEYYKREQQPFTEVLLGMEMNGLPLNLDKAAKLREELVPKLAEQAARLDKVLGYPLRTTDGRPGYGSSKLLRQVLFTKLWQEPASVEHGLDINKSTLVADIAKRHDIPKSHVTDQAVEDERFDMVEGRKPAGLEVTKITPKNLIGYYTRRGYGLPPTPPSDPEKSNEPSTAMPVLLTTFPDQAFILSLREWAKVRKVISTYLDAYPKFTRPDLRYKDKHRLYGSFSQTGTKTGRISSARPNLMNQPSNGPLGKKIRELFEGRLIIGDHNQLEPRLAAHFSQDPKLLEVYEKGLDVYAVTAAGIFGGEHGDYPKDSPKRGLAKPIYLGDQYGAGSKKLTMLCRLNGFNVQEAEVKRFQTKMRAHFGTLTAWKEATMADAKRRGYVTTLDGHRRRLDKQFKGGWKDKAYGERQAVNAIIQGSAADIMRRGMVKAYHEFPEFKMLAQVHDEVLFECAADVWNKDDALLMDLRYVMEVGHGFDLSVPLVFEPMYCANWSQKGVGTPFVVPDDEDEDLPL